jgi:hypothetical protein
MDSGRPAFGCASAAVSVVWEPAGEGVVGCRIRSRQSLQGHGAAPQLSHRLLPDGRIVLDVHTFEHDARLHATL